MRHVYLQRYGTPAESRDLVLDRASRVAVPSEGDVCTELCKAHRDFPAYTDATAGDESYFARKVSHLPLYPKLGH
jgi:hypothetical protein